MTHEQTLNPASSMNQPDFFAGYPAQQSLPSTRPAPKVSLLRPTTTADRVTFTSLVRVEARKFLDTRAGAWLLALSLVGTVGIGLLGAVFFKPLADAIGTNWAGLANFAGLPVNLLVPAMVILLFTTEWTQRTTLTTFSLEPRRGRVLAAKGVVAMLVAVAMWLVQYLMSAAGSAMGGAIHGITIDWTVHWKTMLTTLVAYALTMAMAAGFGLLLMNTAAAIVVYMALPMVVSTLTMIGGTMGQVLNWIDLGSASVPLMTGKWGHNDGWQLLVASLIWVVVPVAAGVIRNLRTEAK